MAVVLVFFIKEYLFMIYDDFLKMLYYNKMVMIFVYYILAR
ncbi:hypothetical protein SDC9_73325 [bioreactor metagenome]|uniref:Uncharacterized protein n=1 Tax=bioreactor metagenome TaxID=1076179 RepID=A0A644YEF2_9ZZZZ